jgi:transcriptional regulator with XRE-family HTH domain
MRPSQLTNYLRANRKRLALSQDEVAFLLGGHNGAKISRYENFTRVPSLETALALEAVYKRAASELFGGLYQKAERKVAKRAKILIERKAPGSGSQTASKRKLLVELARM